MRRRGKRRRRKRRRNKRRSKSLAGRRRWKRRWQLPAAAINWFHWFPVGDISICNHQHAAASSSFLFGTGPKFDKFYWFPVGERSSLALTSYFQLTMPVLPVWQYCLITFIGVFHTWQSIVKIWFDIWHKFQIQSKHVMIWHKNCTQKFRRFQNLHKFVWNSYKVIIKNKNVVFLNCIWIPQH